MSGFGVWWISNARSGYLLPKFGFICKQSTMALRDYWVFAASNYDDPSDLLAGLGSFYLAWKWPNLGPLGHNLCSGELPNQNKNTKSKVREIQILRLAMARWSPALSLSSDFYLLIASWWNSARLLKIELSFKKLSIWVYICKKSRTCHACFWESC